MATITCTPTSPTAVKDFCRINVDAADQNDDTAYDSSAYPASPELRYYLTFTVGGVELGRSYIFGVDENGDHIFNNYIFPEAGSWTITLANAATDATVATQAVTVA